MPIINEYQPNTYISDGITVRFNFNFPIINKENVHVTAEYENEVKELIYGVDYIVENAFDYYNGGWVILNQPVPINNTVRIERRTDITQNINLLNLQSISPKNLTFVFDKLTIIAQELRQYLVDANNTIHFSKSSLIDYLNNVNEIVLQNKTSGQYPFTVKYNTTTSKWDIYVSEKNLDELLTQATETKLGVVFLATIAEAIAGTDQLKAITPNTLQSFYTSRRATAQESITGTDNNKYTTPADIEAHYVSKKATYQELQTNEDTHYLTNYLLNAFWSQKKASAVEANKYQDADKFLTPYSGASEIENKFVDHKAVYEDISLRLDNYKYMSVKQVYDLILELIAGIPIRIPLTIIENFTTQQLDEMLPDIRNTYITNQANAYIQANLPPGTTLQPGMTMDSHDEHPDKPDTLWEYTTLGIWANRGYDTGIPLNEIRDGSFLVLDSLAEEAKTNLKKDFLTIDIEDNISTQGYRYLQNVASEVIENRVAGLLDTPFTPGDTIDLIYSFATKYYYFRTDSDQWFLVLTDAIVKNPQEMAGTTWTYNESGNRIIISNADRITQILAGSLVQPEGLVMPLGMFFRGMKKSDTSLECNGLILGDGFHSVTALYQFLNANKTNKNIVLTFQEYQAYLNQWGECRLFGLDEANQRIRLPRFTLGDDNVFSFLQTYRTNNQHKNQLSFEGQIVNANDYGYEELINLKSKQPNLFVSFDEYNQILTSATDGQNIICAKFGYDLVLQQFKLPTILANVFFSRNGASTEYFVYGHEDILAAFGTGHFIGGDSTNSGNTFGVFKPSGWGATGHRKYNGGYNSGVNFNLTFGGAKGESVAPKHIKTKTLFKIKSSEYSLLKIFVEVGNYKISEIEIDEYEITHEGIELLEGIDYILNSNHTYRINFTGNGIVSVHKNRIVQEYDVINSLDIDFDNGDKVSWNIVEYTDQIYSRVFAKDPIVIDNYKGNGYTIQSDVFEIPNYNEYNIRFTQEGTLLNNGTEITYQAGDSITLMDEIFSIKEGANLAILELNIEHIILPDYKRDFNLTSNTFISCERTNYLFNNITNFDITIQQYDDTLNLATDIIVPANSKLAIQNLDTKYYYHSNDIINIYQDPISLTTIPYSNTFKDQKYINDTPFVVKLNDDQDPDKQYAPGTTFYIDNDGDEINQAPQRIKITNTPTTITYNPTGNNRYLIEDITWPGAQPEDIYDSVYDITTGRNIQKNTEFNIEQDTILRIVIPTPDPEEEPASVVDHLTLDPKFVYEMTIDYMDNNNNVYLANDSEEGGNPDYTWNPQSLTLDKIVYCSEISFPSLLASNYGYWNDMDLSYANSVPNILKIGRYMRGDNTIYSLYVISIIADLLPETLEEGISYTNNTGVTITNGTTEIVNGITFAGDGFEWDFKDQPITITVDMLPMFLTTGIMYKNLSNNVITNGTMEVQNNKNIIGDNQNWDIKPVVINLDDLPYTTINQIYYHNNTGISITNGITVIAIDANFFGDGNVCYNTTPYSITKANSPYNVTAGMNYTNNTGQQITNGINTISDGTTFIAATTSTFAIVPISIGLSSLPFTTTLGLIYKNETGYSITSGSTNVINGNSFTGDGMDWDTIITSITTVPYTTTDGIRYRNDTGNNITDGSEVVNDGVVFRGNGNVWN